MGHDITLLGLKVTVFERQGQRSKRNYATLPLPCMTTGEMSRYGGLELGSQCKTWSFGRWSSSFL